MYNTGQTGLVWTTDGDLLKSSDRKLIKVSGFDNFIRRIMFLLQTEPGTYRYDPSVGAGLTRYVGRVNTSELRDEIQRTILNQLISNDIVYPYIPSVVVTKINQQAINISISINNEHFTYQSAIAFDIKNNKVVAIGADQTLTPHDTVPPLSPGSKSSANTNKYLSRK